MTASGSSSDSRKEDDLGENGSPDPPLIVAKTTGVTLPRDELLEAVRANDEARLRHALEHADHADLDYAFPHPHFCNVIHIATQNGSPKVVGLLLSSGASPNSRDFRGKKYTALHYAAAAGDSEVIRLLLEKGADVNAKEGEFSRSSLHLLASKWNPSNEESMRQALMELLKHKKIKIDRQDNTGATPLFLAAQRKATHMIETLIYKGADLNVVVGLKSVKEVIEKKCPGLLETIDQTKIESVVQSRDYSDDLYEAMLNENISTFKDILIEVNEKEIDSKRLILEEDHGEYTLLNYACDHGLTEFLQVLLREGADVTHADKTTFLCPILYAAKNGNHKVLQVLMYSLDQSGSLKSALKMTDRKLETALHKVVKREHPETHQEEVNYLECLQILLKYKNFLNVDAQDTFLNTPLHYAVLCNDQSFVRHLLINGANLGVKNIFGTLAVTRIQPAVLEDVLNECVKHRNNVIDRDFEIILRYSMLAPPTTDPKPETDCLKFLSGSKQHRHLLRHPVIDTFLFLKWQRIRHYYFLNLMAYATFLILITAYIVLFFRDSVSKNSDLTEPPLNATLGDATPFITWGLPTFELGGGEEGGGGGRVGVKIALQILISILWVFGVVRESVQFTVSWKKYISSLENWLEISILVMTLVLLFIPLEYSDHVSISSWLILTSWVELVLILGRHPFFSIYITMFTTVSFNFLKFIIMFSFVVIAFSLSFFLEFQVNENFNSYTKTFLKTIAMSTGELEYTDLPLSYFPLSSRLLFVIFVFLVVLVLMNLLNGLAVSDIQLIQQEAELVSYKSRVELIAYIESVFLANWDYEGQFRKERVKDWICKMEDCCFKSCFESSNPFKRFLNFLGKRTLMFRNCLKDHQVVVFPNRSDEHRWHVCSCHSFHLKETQIEAAKTVVLSEEAKVSDRLSALESQINSLLSAVVSLTSLVQKKDLVTVVTPVDAAGTQ